MKMHRIFRKVLAVFLMLFLLIGNGEFVLAADTTPPRIKAEYNGRIPDFFFFMNRDIDADFSVFFEDDSRIASVSLQFDLNTIPPYFPGVEQTPTGMRGRIPTANHNNVGGMIGHHTRRFIVKDGANNTYTSPEFRFRVFDVPQTPTINKNFGENISIDEIFSHIKFGYNGFTAVPFPEEQLVSKEIIQVNGSQSSQIPTYGQNSLMVKYTTKWGQTLEVPVKLNFTSQTFTVSFLNEDASVIASKTVEGGEKTDASGVSEPTKDGGYRFLGWTKQGDSEPFAFSDTVIDSDLVLVPKFEKLYEVIHTFSPGSSGKTLPEEIENRKPANQTGKIKGDSVNPTDFAEKTFVDVVNDGTWTFGSWDATQKQIGTSNQTFVGTWNFTPNTYQVSYSFVPKNTQRTLPAVVLNQLPQAQHGKLNAETVAAPTTPFTDVEETDGTWSFEAWDEQTKTVNKANLTFEGSWIFTPKAATLKYEFTSATPNKPLPAGIETLKPADKATSYGTTETPQSPTANVFEVEDGTWKFKGYDQASLVVDQDEEIFLGSWEFTPALLTAGNGIDKPEGYVSITFVADPVKGDLQGETSFYANPTKNISLTAPNVNPKTGFTPNGWDHQNLTKTFTQDTRINAMFTEIADVVDGSQPKPAGYVEIIFTSDATKGTLAGTFNYFVNPGKEVQLTAPTVNPKTGFTRNRWDQNLTQTFAQDTTINANYSLIEATTENKTVKLSENIPDISVFISNKEALPEGTTFVWKDGEPIKNINSVTSLAKKIVVSYPGNIERELDVMISFIDDINPEITVNASFDAPVAKSHTINVSATDNYQLATLKYGYADSQDVNACAGVNAYAELANGSDVVLTDASKNGKYVCIEATDTSGRKSYKVLPHPVNLDTEVPSGTIIGVPTEWTANSVTLTLTTTKPVYPPEGWTPKNPDGQNLAIEFTKIVPENSSQTFQLVDKLGNTSADIAYTVEKIDKEKPVITSLAIEGNKKLIKDIDVQVNFTGQDTGGSQIKEYQCKINDGAWKVCSAPFRIANADLKEGENTIAVKVIDNAGNDSTQPANPAQPGDPAQPNPNDTITIIRDKTLPVIRFAEPSTNPEREKTISFSAEDNHSLKANIQLAYVLIGAGELCDESQTFVAGSQLLLADEAQNGKVLCAKAQDEAGNVSYATSKSIAGIDRATSLLPILDQQRWKRGRVVSYFVPTQNADGIVLDIVQVGELPQGLQYANGEISGKPTKTGTYPVEIVYQNAAGTQVKGTLEIRIYTSSSYSGGGNGTIQPGLPPLVIDSSVPPLDIPTILPELKLPEPEQPEKIPEKINYQPSEIYNPTIIDGICYTRRPYQGIQDSLTISTSEEFKKALSFLWSYEMTMYDGVDGYDPYRNLSRQEAAKIFSQFAMNVLCRKPDKNLKISYSDVANADPTLKPYITLAYQLGVMKGSGMGDGLFRPFDYISKAEVNAVLIRMILKSYLDEGQSVWYSKYNEVATSLRILTQGAGMYSVTRNDVALMLFRAYKEQVFDWRNVDYFSFVLEKRDLFLR